MTTTSSDALESIDVPRLEALVLSVIRDAGPRGVTADELLARFPTMAYSWVTARPAALKRKGLVADSGGRRPGRSGRSQAVLVATRYTDRGAM